MCVCRRGIASSMAKEVGMKAPRRWSWSINSSRYTVPDTVMKNYSNSPNLSVSLKFTFFIKKEKVGSISKFKVGSQKVCYYNCKCFEAEAEGLEVHLWLSQNGKAIWDTCGHLVYVVWWCGWLTFVPVKGTEADWCLLECLLTVMSTGGFAPWVHFINGIKKIEIPKRFVGGSTQSIFFGFLRVQHDWKTWHVSLLKRKQVHQ